MSRIAGIALILLFISFNIGVEGQGIVNEGKFGISNFNLSERALKKVANYSMAKNKILEKQLLKFKKDQNKFLKKLCKINPNQADVIFKRWSISGGQLESDLNSCAPKYFNSNKVYNSFDDSLVVMTNYIDKFKDSCNGEQVNSTNEASEAASTIQREQVITNYMRQQKSEMKKLAESNLGLEREFKRLDKDFYYMIQKNHYLDGYLKNNKLFRKEWVEGLANSDAFIKYFKENSGLLKIAQVPKDWGKSLAGLQTNSAVKNAQRISLDKLTEFGKDAIEENIGKGNSQIRKLKNQNLGFANSSDVPSFKANTLKGKPLKDRINLGSDFQLEAGKNVLPSGIRLGFNLDYQLIVKGFVGIGIGFKYPFDKRPSLYNLSYRSYFDYKLKNILFASVGYELNAIDPVTKFQEHKLKTNKEWYGFNGYESLLLGLKIKKPTKGHSTVDISLQVDPLYNSHSPATSFIVYRIGYGF